jgi:dihydropteroate synthase
MTLNCKGNLVDLSTPKIMGILNCTPDSFFDGGKYKSEKEIINQIEKMLFEGASFIDVGAYSSKPGADFVSETEETNRLLPVIDLILKHFPKTLLSVDTFRSTVAKKAIENGAALINDISAGTLDPNMMSTVANLQVPYIMMHLKGTPQTMHNFTNYDNVVKEILFYFSEKTNLAKKNGINDIIVDPGFGFAKTLEQNFEILEKLALFQTLEYPLLVGVSRKSMVYKTLETDAQNSLNGTTALHAIALQKGAKILRVHDVKEAVECVKLMEKLKAN